MPNGGNMFYQVLDVPNSPSLSDNPDITGQLVDLIMIFWNVFYREGNCGGTDIMEHPVYTPKGLPPIRLKNRPINPGLIDALKEQIATWLKDGVIRSGRISPWNFPLLPVRKKNGKWRWIVDFRMLNSVTRKDSFPIPNIVELLSYLRKSNYFTSLDLAQAFHSIPVREIDREKLSFCALDKSYQFCQMPFGLTQGCQTHFRSGAAWSKSILTRAGKKIFSFLKKKPPKKLLLRHLVDTAQKNFP